jgi:hypothetical protein
VAGKYSDGAVCYWVAAEVVGYSPPPRRLRKQRPPSLMSHLDQHPSQPRRIQSRFLIPRRPTQRQRPHRITPPPDRHGNTGNTENRLLIVDGDTLPVAHPRQLPMQFRTITNGPGGELLKALSEGRFDNARFQ